MSINRRMDKEDVAHTHNGILLSHHNDDIMLSAATWMDLEMITLRKSERERQIYDITYMQNLK